MLAFILINIIWDVLTSKTERFHFKTLANKTDVAYSASTFSSSLIILLSIPQPVVAQTVGDVVAPLVLVGIVGLLHSLGKICPYES